MSSGHSEEEHSFPFVATSTPILPTTWLWSIAFQKGGKSPQAVGLTLGAFLLHAHSFFFFVFFYFFCLLILSFSIFLPSTLSNTHSFFFLSAEIKPVPHTLGTCTPPRELHPQCPTSLIYESLSPCSSPEISSFLKYSASRWLSRLPPHLSTLIFLSLSHSHSLSRP